jgi:Tfp pilus assembly protein PilF
MKLTPSLKKMLLVGAALVLCGVLYYFTSAGPATNPSQHIIDEHREAAGAYIQQQDYPAAAKELREIVRLEPDDPDAQLVLGTTLYKGGQKREAADVFRKLAKRDDYAGAAAKKFLQERLHVKP